MGPRSDNRGYGHICAELAIQRPASMGPRSDNRGYGRYLKSSNRPKLQLQWVRGPITAVMIARTRTFKSRLKASMGPRSDNRGYVNVAATIIAQSAASMGPRSDNRGYVGSAANSLRFDSALQWARRPITGVLVARGASVCPLSSGLNGSGVSNPRF